MSADLDKAIDRAVRDMLDVEPPADLRGRVLDRIEQRPASSFRLPAFGWGFGAVAIAAAALAVIAIGRLGHDVPVMPVAPIAAAVPPRTAPPPAAPIDETPTVVARREPAPAPALRSHRARDARMVVATVASVEDVNFATIEPLAGPHDIGVERLGEPAQAHMPSIEPAALGIRALEVTALSGTPQSGARSR
jgi:hypothetical protein